MGLPPAPQKYTTQDSPINRSKLIFLGHNVSSVQTGTVYDGKRYRVHIGDSGECPDVVIGFGTHVSHSAVE